MALSENGFQTKRFDTILKEINDDFSSNAGVSIDTSSDSVANSVNSAVSKQITELWELGESIEDNTNILEAEGQALDNLGLQVGLIREPDQKSSGVAHFTGSNGTAIGTTAIASTARGDTFSPSSTVNISPSSCISTVITVLTVLDDTLYQVTVDGVQYNYLSLGGTTAEVIIDGLETELANGSSLFTTTLVDTTTLRIDIDQVGLDAGNTLNITGVTYLSFSSITSLGIVISEEFGFIEGAAHTLTFINTPINGWDAIDNPTDMTLGRFVQTDDEFRTSILNNYEIKDSTTYQGVKNALEAVLGVSSVDIFDNEEFYTQTYNTIPVKGKGYMCTIDGGVSEDIAQVLWDTKPLGIKMFGNISFNVTDNDGQIHLVSFSRSLPQFFYIKISYTKYLEEDFPADGEDLIKQSCLLFGDGLGIGDDVIPQRFEGAIFDDVTGIDSLTVQIAYSTDSELPINDGSLTYTTARIPMSTTESPLFATNRMEVTLV